MYFQVVGIFISTVTRELQDYHTFQVFIMIYRTQSGVIYHTQSGLARYLWYND